MILTTGTFLKGLVHIGLQNYSAGRAGDFAAMGLSDSLAALGFRIGRLKTGTCPRLDAAPSTTRPWRSSPATIRRRPSRFAPPASRRLSCPAI